MQIRKIFRNKANEWRTGWRIVAMMALTVGVVALLNIAWKAAGLPGRKDSTAWQFLAFAALITGATLAVIALLLRLFEKRGPDAIWLPFDRTAWKFAIQGTLLGAIPICLLLGTAVVAGYGEVVPGTLDAASIGSILLPTLLAGFLLAGWEELLLRGYLLRQLSLGINPVAAAVMTGILFGLMHSGNPGANWQGLLYTAIGGTLMGLLVLRSGSLWLLIGYHFGWNASSSGLFGLELSGLDIGSGIFASTLSGPDWLTGGSYGFEASLPAVVCEVLVLSIAFRFVWTTSRNSGLRSVP